MKKTIVLFLIGLMLVSPMAFALRDVREVGALPQEGFKYGLKKMFERLDLLMTFNKQKRAEKRLFYAEVRQKELEQAPEEFADELQADFEDKLDEAEVEAEDLPNRAEIIGHVLQMRQKHIQVLERVRVKLQAKEVSVQGIENAIQKSQQNIQRIEDNKVGGEQDEHGCYIAAGYTWCESKQKCLRPWESKCPSETTVMPGGFCGESTFADCESDEDCIMTGC